MTGNDSLKPTESIPLSKDAIQIKAYKCERCGNHGKFVKNMRGHKSYCPYFYCKCLKCRKITEKKIFDSLKNL